MSLNVVNPYQVFRDSNGVPRSFGQLTFFNNKTAVKATIFSDEDLEVEQNNPYDLDEYGRVVGDIKYAGLLTVQEANEDGGDIITHDDVGATPHLGSGINHQTGTTYAIKAGDHGIIVSGEHATNTTITLLGATVAGNPWNSAIIAGGVGTVTITGTIGTIVNPVLQPGETLVYWGDGTVYEGFICPFFESVANFPTSRVGTVEGNIGVSTVDSLDVDSTITVDTWDDIGPTGAANEWSALDAVPVNANYIKVRIYIAATGTTNADTYYKKLYTRKNGDSTGKGPDTMIAIAEVINRSGSLESDKNILTAEIPIDSSNTFEAYWQQLGTANGGSITLRLVGWGI